MRTMFVSGVTLLAMTAAVSAQAPKYGPAKGTLMIVGGNLHDSTLYKRFIEYAGGPSKLILVIPTAGDLDTFSSNYAGFKAWRDAGATNLAVLHTRRKDIANADTFVAHIKAASGVFFEGGRQWKLADAYLNTRVQTELNNLLARGGVIGGSSAGATIQGSFMVRGDTKGNQIMVGDHTEGLGFLRNAAVDQHVLVRNRVYDLIPVIESHPDLLGIGIDENTAIVVQADTFIVYGESHVMIYDHHHTFGDGGKFYFLSRNDHYNMATRTPSRPGGRGGDNFFAALKAEEWK
jgi:cyanophycinase